MIGLVSIGVTEAACFYSGKKLLGRCWLSGSIHCPNPVKFASNRQPETPRPGARFEATVMKRRSMLLLFATLTTIIALPSSRSIASRRPRTVDKRGSKRSAIAQSDTVNWRGLLQSPQGSAKRLPEGWEVRETPRGFRARGSAASGGTYQPPITVDEMTRAASLILVGTSVGHDGSFYSSANRHSQYTTYYLRVAGYLKDATQRRAPYVKVLAPGGFLDGGQVAEVPVPFLVPGRRYLLYLIPNRGVIWGLTGSSDELIGKRDEYWVVGQGVGRWWEDEGRLVGEVPARLHHEVPEGTEVPTYLPFGAAIARVAAAIERERRGIPYDAPR